MCLVASFSHPHDPYVSRPEFWDLYRDADIDMPALPPVAFDDLDPHSQRLWQASAIGDYDITPENVRNSRHGYYAAISYVDSKFAQIVAALEDTGMMDDCAVAIIADHGDFLGERGLWYKMSYLENPARVPIIISSPKRFGPSRRKAAASLSDIAPTLVDLARTGAAAEMVGPLDGESLLPLLTGPDDPERTIYGEYLAEGVVAPMFMIRTGKWKFIHCASDPGSALRHRCRPAGTDQPRRLARPCRKGGGLPRPDHRALRCGASHPRRDDQPAITADAVQGLVERQILSVGFPAAARCFRAVHPQPARGDRTRPAFTFSEGRGLAKGGLAAGLGCRGRRVQRVMAGLDPAIHAAGAATGGDCGGMDPGLRRGDGVGLWGRQQT